MVVITLSFDNGPDPDVTPYVLDVLRRCGVAATFFAIGDKLRDRRALCEQAKEEGHWLGNHTFNHLVPLGSNSVPGAAASEIDRTERLLGDLAHERRFFRPFGAGGLLDKRLLNMESYEFLLHRRYTCVLWNVVPRDWLEPESWTQRAIAQCFSRRESLVVLHDVPTGAMRHLERFINEAQARGACFRQEFPADCLPIVCGNTVLPMHGYISDTPFVVDGT